MNYETQQSIWYNIRVLTTKSKSTPWKKYAHSYVSEEAKMSSLKNQVIKWCNMFLFQCRPIWYNVPRIYEICNVHLFSSHDKLKYSCQPFSLSMIFMSHRPSYNLIHLAIVLSHSEATSTTNHKVFHNHRHFRLLFF